MNNTKDWEEYRKDVSNSERVGEYIANMIDHDEREKLKILLDICEKSKKGGLSLDRLKLCRRLWKRSFCIESM